LISRCNAFPNACPRLNIHRYGIGRVMEMALGHVGSDTPIHLSFDVDALDPQWAPSTGTPVRGGLTLREGDYIAECVHETGSLVAMDLVRLWFCSATSRLTRDCRSRSTHHWRQWEPRRRYGQAVPWCGAHWVTRYYEKPRGCDTKSRLRNSLSGSTRVIVLFSYSTRWHW